MVAMSVYYYKSSALRTPDPFRACLWGVPKHPHYHDCENCDHAKYATCEYGAHTMKLKTLGAGLAECKALLDKVTVKSRPLPP
jgi:hypothetical protein